MPAVTPATVKRAATNFCCLVNNGTMGVNSLPKTVTRQRRDCDLNPGPSAPESSTLTTRLPSLWTTLVLPCRTQYRTDHEMELLPARRYANAVCTLQHWDCLSVFLTDCQKPVLYQNGCSDRAGSWHKRFVRLILRCLMRKLVYLRNWCTSVWNFVQKSRQKKIATARRPSKVLWT